MKPLSGSEADFHIFQTTRQFGSLDALRALAIVAVIWRHSPALPEGSVPFVDTGVSGVSLFFVLSGFLITTLLLREQSATGDINLRNFYARRTLRIFPLYYAVLGLYTVVVLLREHNAAGRLFLHNLPFYATYTNNWFVDLIVNEDGQRRVIFVFAWSLATEEQFYLVWPWLLKFLKRRLAIAVLVTIAAASFTLKLAFANTDFQTTTFERMLRIARSPAIEICAGVLVAVALNSRSSYTSIGAWLGRRWSAPAAAAASVAVMVLPVGDTPVWRLAQTIAFSALIASCVIREDHGLSRALRLRTLSRVGAVSYGMYMLHMLAINSTRSILGALRIDNAMATFLLSVAFTYVAAECSFRLFERRFLLLKHRFQRPTSTDRILQRSRHSELESQTR